MRVPACRTARALRVSRPSPGATASVAFLALLVGCRCQRPDQVPAPLAPSATAGTVAPRAPDLTAEPKLDGTRFANDSRWVRAGQGGPIDLEILARSEGGAGLLEGIELGGTPARTALAALPFAPDAEIAVGRVCEWLGGAPSAQATPFLLAIHGVADRPPISAEALDPSWIHRCDGALHGFLARSDVSATDHDLAQSARRMVAEHDLGR
jgi:hypothetical protein